MLITELPIFITYLQKTLPECQHEMRRLFHGRGQMWAGLEQITADWIGEHLIITLFKPVDDVFLAELKQQLVSFSNSAEWLQASGKGIGLQHRYEHGAPFESVVGEVATEVVGIENGLKYQLVLGKNQNMGIFLDMRNGRQWVKERSHGKKVLNLFSYTCGFSVAAMAGGAENVVNIDMAKGALSRGRDNHRLNEHDLSNVTFLGHDIFRSWGKITKFGPYDLIIIDPPSFQKGSFALTKDYKKILRRLPGLLTAGGEVLACVNSPAVSPDFLTTSMAEEAPDLSFVERLANPVEFADLDEQASLKALVFNLQ
ncbi:class I SAM-dependent methyltransferase [Vibrio rumoiensis]|uniref:Methyltransferase n=1 Tax=Vibrio rumoiensis 1S-45 TaxID=1188252 RepID=A0A1E5E4P1_9VIBR|nr:class I SAM-dependent methyltransferase [Vibrio rumoiensis]OEF27449.1 methyltransferase [Vibrio rumoiensis 1S-45]